MIEIAFRVTRREAEAASTPAYHAPITVRKQAEGQDRHGDAQDREPAAELVVKGIPKEDFELEHRSGILCPESS